MSANEQPVYSGQTSLNGIMQIHPDDGIVYPPKRDGSTLAFRNKTSYIAYVEAAQPWVVEGLRAEITRLTVERDEMSAALDRVRALRGYVTSHGTRHIKAYRLREALGKFADSSADKDPQP